MYISSKPMDWSNPKTTKGIRYSRYIASWTRTAKEHINDRNLFEKWLKTQGLTDDEVIDILEQYHCGKMELEHDIKRFMQTNS